jgi:hypothetical protein
MVIVHSSKAAGLFFLITFFSSLNRRTYHPQGPWPACALSLSLPLARLPLAVLVQSFGKAKERARQTDGRGRADSTGGTTADGSMFDWVRLVGETSSWSICSLNFDRSVVRTHYSEAANLINLTSLTGSLLCVRIVGGRYSRLIGKIHMHGSTRGRGQLRDRARLYEIVDAREWD